MSKNPLRDGLRFQRMPQPCVFVIFGASGDLTKRKLIPALYNLAEQNMLAPGFSIVGTGRTLMSDDAFREAMRAGVQEFADAEFTTTLWNNFASGLYYHAADPTNEESFRGLTEKLASIDSQRSTSGNRLFYLSTPPNLYDPIIRNLGSAKENIQSNGRWRRIVIEKPFGRDLVSALQLNEMALRVFDENQIYRIDHYLGKETVQNIMVLRFANGIFEPLWNRQYVDHVQLTSAESIGVENRGGYYEQAGALRDMIQNHMLQLLSLVGMEPPAELSADAVRDEKTKLIHAIRNIEEEDVYRYAVRGQYGEGSIDGRPVKGYRQEGHVSPTSSTETYAALKLYIDNWRWAEVPFYLRSGKRLPKRVTEIAIQFKPTPHYLFKQERSVETESNSLIIRIQPDEGVSLKFGAKVPGQATRIRTVHMDFQYGTSFGKKSPEAYERLLLDAMLGDSTLYARGDMVELSWRLVTPIMQVWNEPARRFPNYAAGSWGPREAEELIERDGRRWRRP